MDASEDDLSDIELPASKGSKVRVRRKWLIKHVAINEQVVNISPTISHAHKGVDDCVVGFVEGLSDTTLDGDMAFVGSVIVGHLAWPPRGLTPGDIAGICCCCGSGSCWP